MVTQTRVEVQSSVENTLRVRLVGTSPGQVFVASRHVAMQWLVEAIIEHDAFDCALANAVRAELGERFEFEPSRDAHFYLTQSSRFVSRVTVDYECYAPADWIACGRRPEFLDEHANPYAEAVFCVETSESAWLEHVDEGDRWTSRSRFLGAPSDVDHYNTTARNLLAAGAPFHRVEPWTDMVLALVESDFTAWKTRVDSLLSHQQWEAVESEATRALWVVDEAQRVEFCVARARALTALGRPMDALFDDLDEALEIDPRHAEARLLRARSFARQKKYQRAVEDVDELLLINPASEPFLALRTAWSKSQEAD